MTNKLLVFCLQNDMFYVILKVFWQVTTVGNLIFLTELTLRHGI